MMLSCDPEDLTRQLDHGVPRVRAQETILMHAIEERRHYLFITNWSCG
jgi:hypothetical protein